MSIPLVVTKSYEKGQRVNMVTARYSIQQRSKSRQALAKSNQPRTSETYRREDDVFRYELQFLMSGVLPSFRNLNSKLQRKPAWCAAAHPASKVIKSESKRRHVRRHFRSNSTDQCQNGSSRFLTPYREQPRSTRIVVTYPRPALPATKRGNHAPISFDQQAQVSQGHTSYRNNAI